MADITLRQFTLGYENEKIASLADKVKGENPKILRKESVDLLQKHGWWLREADRHATGGFYDGGEFTILNLVGFEHFDNSDIANAERELDGLLLKRRWLELYEKVESTAHQRELFIDNMLGLPALLNGTYSGILKDLKKILEGAEVYGVDSLTDVLLPRNVMKMNYPFSYFRLRLPPTPADLRVLFDWEVDFRDCLDEGYLFELENSMSKRGERLVSTKYDGDYRKHNGAKIPIENWVLDLAEYNNCLKTLVTFNGTQGRIDFAVRQVHMHKKFWLYKVQKVHEYFDGKPPMLHDPRELYNAARRAIRRTDSYLTRLANETAAEYHTFPPSINP